MKRRLSQKATKLTKKDLSPNFVPFVAFCKTPEVIHP
jgi:hypothetical protein